MKEQHSGAARHDDYLQIFLNIKVGGGDNSYAVPHRSTPVVVIPIIQVYNVPSENGLIRIQIIGIRMLKPPSCLCLTTQ